MDIQAMQYLFLAVLIYFLGCKRTQIKFDLISIMTPKEYRNFTEIKLHVAKAIIVLLLVVVFLEKFNG